MARLPITALCALVVSATATAQSTLLKNGDAELGIADWTAEGGATTVAYANTFEPASRPPNAGRRLFSGGTAARSTLSQWIALPSAEFANVDSHQLAVAAEGFFGGVAEQSDRAYVTLRFHSAYREQVSLGSLVIGADQPMPHRATTLTRHASQLVAVPPNTRFLHVEVTFLGVESSKCDGYVDSLALTLHRIWQPRGVACGGISMSVSGPAAIGQRVTFRVVGPSKTFRPSTFMIFGDSLAKQSLEVIGMPSCYLQIQNPLILPIATPYLQTREAVLNASIPNQSSLLGSRFSVQMGFYTPLVLPRKLGTTRAWEGTIVKLP